MRARKKKSLARRCVPVIILSAVMVGCGDDGVTDNTGPFTGGSTESFYLSMSDGVRLALDVTVPEPLGSGVQVPTIVTMTRYWRGDEGGGGMSDIFDWRVQAAARRGYAFVVIDERGTGASFGTWPHAWSETSLEDFEEIVDWVVSREWSDGQVAVWGISYLGMAAQHLAALDHPAVKAAVPTFTQYDLYTDIVYPGGIFLDTYVRDWHLENVELDNNQVSGREVKRVDADPDGTLLEEAVSEHATNGNTYDMCEGLVYRDRQAPVQGISLDDISAHTRRVALEGSGVALYHWGSWMDQANAHSALTRFLTLSNPQHAVIGPWEHGGFGHAGPYDPAGLPPEPSEAEQWDQILAFLDSYLMEDDGPPGGRLLSYYTYGADEWRSTSVWPVEGTMMESLYFQADNALSASAPTDPTSSDVYTVDFTATTGSQTRWDGPVDYGDRRDEDLKLLTYTTAALAEDTEITGYPIVTLYVSSTHSDGAFFVYLEDVDPAGQVTYITEGQLRALHRKVSTESPAYELVIPYHSFKEQDAELLTPGEVTEISFGLLPTSVVIQAGHRIRVAIAGHDAGWFARVPESGDPVVTVMRNQTHASRIAIPVVRLP